jgi:hypothetical protein
LDRKKTLDSYKKRRALMKYCWWRVCVAIRK